MVSPKMWAQPQKTKKGGTQGDNSESAAFGFGLDNFAVFAGNPADLRIDYEVLSRVMRKYNSVTYEVG